MTMIIIVVTSSNSISNRTVIVVMHLTIAASLGQLGQGGMQKRGQGLIDFRVPPSGRFVAQVSDLVVPVM